MRGHREWRLPPRRVPRSRRILRGFRVATQGFRCPPRLANADVLARMATSDLARDLIRGGLPFCLRKVVPRPPPGRAPSRLASARHSERGPLRPRPKLGRLRLAPAASFRLTSLSSTDLESCVLLTTESGLPEEEEYGTPRSRHHPSDSHWLRKRRRLKHDLPGPPFVGPHRGAHRPQTQAIESSSIHRRGQDMSLRVAIVGDKLATTRVGITKVLWTFPGG